MQRAIELSTVDSEPLPLPRVSPSSLYSLIKPSRCDLRVWLGAHGIEEDPPGAFRGLIMQLGIEHERRHLPRFPGLIDIATYPREEQAELTRVELREADRVIYQGRLQAVAEVDGRRIEITGHPDFMLPARRGWAIRDSKINRSISDYIRLQLHLYAWLYEQTTGEQPVALQVHAGSGEILDVPLEPELTDRALEMAARIIALREEDAPRPDEHVGVSKCGGCDFHGHCWPPALERGDVGILPRFDRGLVEVLHSRGTHTVEQLIADWDEESLAALERPWGQGGRRKPVGEIAARMIKSAEARVSGAPILLAEPELPDPPPPTWVMFDLEGMPPTIDELEKIYIWGLQCFGEGAGPFRPAVAGFGPGSGGDREGWFAFLTEAGAIFSEHGDLPFAHWATYERVKIDLYLERYGDDAAGTAARIKDNLLDLLPITYAAVAVPLSSYSLKDIETLTGYERQLDEYGGDWSMARYIEATESSDHAEREAIMGQILDYNREDLEATWAVLEWLRGLG